jgi:hypothetical protein
MLQGIKLPLYKNNALALAFVISMANNQASFGIVKSIP